MGEALEVSRGRTSPAVESRSSRARPPSAYRANREWEAACRLTGQSTRTYYQPPLPAYCPPVIFDVRSQMARFWLAIAFGAFCAQATAQVERPPGHIFGLYSKRTPVCFNASTERAHAGYDCEGETANWLLVVPAANNGIWVQMNLLFHNGHTCELRGNGAWTKSHVLVRLDEPEGCELRVHFRRGRAVLSDEGGKCRMGTCGARGSYDGIKLPKRGSM